MGGVERELGLLWHRNAHKSFNKNVYIMDYEIS